jgi:hypothetical protein
LWKIKRVLTWKYNSKPLLLLATYIIISENMYSSRIWTFSNHHGQVFCSHSTVGSGWQFLLQWCCSLSVCVWLAGAAVGLGSKTQIQRHWVLYLVLCSSSPPLYAVKVTPFTSLFYPERATSEVRTRFCKEKRIAWLTRAEGWVQLLSTLWLLKKKQSFPYPVHRNTSENYNTNVHAQTRFCRIITTCIMILMEFFKTY